MNIQAMAEEWRSARADAKSKRDAFLAKKAHAFDLAWDRDTVRALERELEVTLAEIESEEASNLEKSCRHALALALDSRDAPAPGTHAGLLAQLTPLVAEVSRLEAALAVAKSQAEAAVRAATEGHSPLASRRSAADEPGPLPFLFTHGPTLGAVVRKLEESLATPTRKLDTRRLRDHEADLRGRIEIALREAEAKKERREAEEADYERNRAAQREHDTRETAAFAARMNAQDQERRELVEAHKSRG